MTIRAYQEIYLSNAQAVLGDAFDYAVNVCRISGKDFVKLFLVSSFSSRMERGEPAIISGKSGIELVQEILLETKGQSFWGWLLICLNIIYLLAGITLKIVSHTKK